MTINDFLSAWAMRANLIFIAAIASGRVSMPDTTHSESQHLRELEADKSSIALYLAFYSDNDKKLGDLLAWSVGRVFLRQASRGEAWNKGVRDDDIWHITHWLKAAIISDERWLKNVNAQGIPKKFGKFTTIAQITAEADKAMTINLQKNGMQSLNETDEEVVAQFEDGYFMVRMKTPKALDNESALMQHCVGLGAYDKLVAEDKVQIFSLRNAANNPHVTIEVSDGAVTQVKGKQNKPPIKAYVEMVQRFISNNKLEVSVPANELGFVIDVDGLWHHYSELPDDLTCLDDVNLYGCRGLKLPKKWRVIRGSLNIGDCGLTDLDCQFDVDGSMTISDNSITALPPGFHCKSHLSAECTDITEIRGDVIIEGDARFNSSHLRYIDPKAYIGGSLDVPSCPIEQLPDDLHLRGGLNISGSNIKTLSNLKVDGYFSANHGKLESFGPNVRITAGCTLGTVKMKTLGSGLRISGFLVLEGSSIDTIEEGVFVRTSIFSNGLVKEFPSSIPDECLIHTRGSPTKMVKNIRKAQERRLRKKEVESAQARRM